ncbi:MAG: aminotransferase class V-fold PLP-dependent enzyme [Clostridia bacterium]|nr:aminotransferase class V-fold PLP-dependent enzyme [Clostridia bacterium]
MNFKKKLLKNSKNILPMHMPGHKRKAIFSGLSDLGFAYDFTETDYLDDLHNPENLILEEEQKVANLYKTERAIFGVNGSTGFILSVIYSLGKKHKNFMALDNCHYSVYNAMRISNLNVFLFSKFKDKTNGLSSGLDYEDLERQIVKNKIEVFIFSYPDYEGDTLDIEKIIEICKKNKVLTVVDEAHGAHFIYDGGFPKNAIKYGADFVIMSLHKTLPALTQTALLLSSKNLIKDYEIEENIKIFETSSPSFVLISSICECVDILIKDGKKLMQNLSENLDKFYRKAEKLKHLQIVNKENRDKSKIVILTDRANISGYELKKILLKKYNIELECAGARYVLAYTTLADEKKDFEKLKNAIFEIDKTLEFANKEDLIFPVRKAEKLEVSQNSKTKIIDLDLAIGEISAKDLYAYPPATPIIFGGEKIKKNQIELLNQLMVEGMNIYGLSENGIVVKS